MKLFICMIIFLSLPVLACIGGGCAKWNCGYGELEEYMIEKEIDGTFFCCKEKDVNNCKKATCLVVEECSNSSSGRKRR